MHGYLVLAGTRPLTSASDLSRFGKGMFFATRSTAVDCAELPSAVGAASNVAQEKDRRTCCCC